MPAGGIEIVGVSISVDSTSMPAFPGHDPYSQQPVPKQEISAADIKTELAANHNLPESAYILPASF